jgi:hypothetical protein
MDGAMAQSEKHKSKAVGKGKKRAGKKKKKAERGKKTYLKIQRQQKRGTKILERIKTKRANSKRMRQMKRASFCWFGSDKRLHFGRWRH